MIREPAVAGRFYPANPKELKHQIENLLGDAVAPKLRVLPMLNCWEREGVTAGNPGTLEGQPPPG